MVATTSRGTAPMPSQHDTRPANAAAAATLLPSTEVLTPGLQIKDGRIVPMASAGVEDPLAALLRNQAKDDIARLHGEGAVRDLKGRSGMGWKGKGLKREEADEMRKLLRKINFPPVPPMGWPNIISWPTPQILEAIKRNQNNMQALAELKTKLEEQAREYAERSVMMDDWINKQNNRPGKYGGKIGFALLLDEMATIHIMNDVTSYEKNRLRFKDGSSLVVKNPDSPNATLSIKDFNAKSGAGMMAIRAALIEARTRGWPSMKFTGSKEFLDAVAKIAAELDYPVELRYRNRYLPGTKTKYVHQKPPLSEKAIKSLEQGQGKGRVAGLDGAIEEIRSAAATGSKPTVAPTAPRNDVFGRQPDPASNDYKPI